jgi:hydroxysqualene dehydroxylase
MSDDIVILGGGFSGLACGVALADAGRKVTLLEKKPHLGGRAYSFKDAETGDVVDNGQHLFMGCYRRTRAFLAKIGTADRLSLLDDIRVDFAEEGGRRDALRCPPWLGSPLHLAAGVLRLKGVSIGDKWNLRRLDAYVRSVRGGAPVPAELDRVTVRQWMDSLGQSRRIQQRLFDPIALGALNDKPEVAAATGFVQVLREAFYTDVESTRLGVANVGLSDLYVHAARRYIEDRGGRVLLNKKVKTIRQGTVIMEDGEEFRNDCVVSTLPPWNLKTLELPASLRGDWERLKAAPIVSLQLWLSRPILDERFVGLLGTEIQWAFNKSRILSLPGGGQCLALVISGAHAHVASEPKALLELAKRDLARCFPEFQKATITRWKVVKEPFATLSPAPGSDARRPEVGFAAPGVVLAGDWTRTGLPATIESAVASGQRAAEVILGGSQHAEVR